MEYTLDSLGIHGQLIGVDEFDHEEFTIIDCDVDSTLNPKTYHFTNYNIPFPEFGNVIHICKEDTLFNLMGRYKRVE